ncbi:MAG: hypothetical protein RIR76_501 [Verrucomicrobiota bacterium]|jgi:hypothetical protein
MSQHLLFLPRAGYALLLLATAGVARSAEQPFLNAPQHVAAPRAEHAVTNRAFQGIPSLAVAPRGRLWANWYAGVTPGEDHNNYVVVSTSGDGGATWKEVLVVDPDGGGPVRTFDPELWQAPDGRLFVFWAQAAGHDGAVAGVWCVSTDTPDAAQPKWSAPRRLTDGIMMCKPLVLSTGEWVLPASTWRATDRSARMVVSTDRGQSWAIRGSANVPVEARQFDEHMFIERRDGSLWLLVRTKYGIGESISTDRGRTWPELTPTTIPHPSARFFISRLNSGNLLLVKHGPMEQKTARSHLMAFVSKDDGRTWGGGLLLDERTGVSYPDGQQTDDGTIRIIYDFSRTDERNILVASFREEDAAGARDVSGAVRLRQLVSKASGGQPKPKAAPKTAGPVRQVEGEPLRRGTPGAWAADGVVAQPLAPGAKLFADRAYVLAELPESLAGAQFLPVAMDGTKTLTCRRAGTVWLLGPSPGRNKDSPHEALLRLGFKPVAGPEVRLFNPSSAGNFCTLYQKDGAAGEQIALGKWAVPVFLP